MEAVVFPNLYMSISIVLIHPVWGLPCDKAAQSMIPRGLSVARARSELGSLNPTARTGGVGGEEWQHAGL